MRARALNSSDPTNSATLSTRLSPLVLGLLTAVALAGTPALAASTSASITDIRYQLIDLDLTDNITPSFTVDYTSIQNSAFYRDDDAGYSYEYIADIGDVQVGGASGSAAAGTSSTAVHSDSSFVSPVGPQRAYAIASHQLGFKLSPNTGLFVSALGSLSNDPVTAHTEASLNFTGVLRYDVNGVRGDQTFASYLDLDAGTRAYTLRGYLETGSVAEQGYLYFRTDTYVSAAPVPEPATYGMLLAGVLVIGAAARRKARRD